MHSMELKMTAAIKSNPMPANPKDKQTIQRHAIETAKEFGFRHQLKITTKNTDDCMDKIYCSSNAGSAWRCAEHI